MKKAPTQATLIITRNKVDGGAEDTLKFWHPEQKPKLRRETGEYLDKDSYGWMDQFRLQPDAFADATGIEIKPGQRVEIKVTRVKPAKRGR